MRKMLVFTTVLLWSWPSLAGIIVLKNHQKIICEGAYEIKGRYLHYKDKDGNLFQLPLKVVDLERSSTEGGAVEIEERFDVVTSEEDRRRKKTNVAFHDMIEEDEIHSKPQDDMAIDDDVLEKHRGRREYNSEWDVLYSIRDMLIAARNGRFSLVMQHLKRGTPVDGPLYDKFNIPPMLIVAAEVGNPEFTRALLEVKADVEVTNSSKETPLLIALNYEDARHNAVAVLLLKAGASVKVFTLTYATPLTRALVLGNPKMVHAVAEAGADVNAVDKDGIYPVFKAIDRQEPLVLKVLLDHGARLNPANAAGNVPVVEAVLEDSIALIELLVQAGAALNTRSRDGRTPLEIALDKNYAETAAYLHQKAPDGDLFKQPRFMVGSVNKGSLAMAGLLLENGADADTADEKGDPVLVIAAHKGFYEMVVLLVAKGADVTAKGANGVTAYVEAGGAKKEDIRKFLRQIYQRAGSQ